MIEKLRLLRAEFTRYFAIGVSALFLDISSLYFLKEYLSLTPTVAVVLNQLIILNYIFLLNKFWAFKSKGVTHRQIIRFYILSGANYIVSIIWMWLFTEYWAVGKFLPINDKDVYLVVRLGNIALSVAWNFLIYKYWVYKTENAEVSQNHTVYN